MKPHYTQLDQANADKQMRRMNRYFRLSLIVFAILLNHSSFSQINEDSVKNGKADTENVNSSTAKNKYFDPVVTEYAKSEQSRRELGAYRNNDGCYITVSMGLGEIFHKSCNGQMQVNIPYSSTDEAGHTTDAVFTSAISNPFAEKQSIPFLMNMEAGFPCNVFGYMDISGPKEEAYFSFGAGYNIKLGNSGIVIKPSMGVGDQSISSGNYEFGQIDNTGKTISILGCTADPTFTYETGGRYNRHQVTEDAQYLEVDYTRDCFDITPRIGIGNNQCEHRFHWEFDIAYNIMMNDKGRVTFTQYGPDAIKSLNEVVKGFGNGYLASCGNHTLTSDPNPFNSLCVGLTIGYNTNELTRHWGHSGYGRGCFSQNNSKGFPPIS